MRTDKKPFGSRAPSYSLLALAAMLFAGCYAARSGNGGGMKNFSERRIKIADIALPASYRIEAVATGLNFPTGVAFDQAGTPYIVESGYSYDPVWKEARLLRIGKNNHFTTVAVGDSNGPWNGVTYRNPTGGDSGAFYIAEGGHLRGGRILRVTLDGKVSVLAEGLPSLGDHHTNGPAIGPDGMLYFGQGTATNSAIVGLDNDAFGWLKRHPEFHDIPCQDLTLTGVNYATPHPRDKRREVVETGAFCPFGTRTLPGQVVRGEVPCSGSLLRIPLQGGKPELYAWGFRNPFALTFSPSGQLFVLDNGFDERGSRPVWGAADLLWKVHQGKWYGWPDYSGSKSLHRSEFTPPHGEAPKPLLQALPGPWLASQASAGDEPPKMDWTADPPDPSAYLPVHSSADGIDFSTASEFGHQGQAFVALFGDMSPGVGKVLEPVGFKVVRIDVVTGVIEDFAVNRKGPGPASFTKTGGFERPVSLRFSPDGRSLYVVDFGVMSTSKGPRTYEHTGVLWRIWKEDGKEGTR